MAVLSSYSAAHQRIYALAFASILALHIFDLLWRVLFQRQTYVHVLDADHVTLAAVFNFHQFTLSCSHCLCVLLVSCIFFPHFKIVNGGHLLEYWLWLQMILPLSRIYRFKAHEWRLTIASLLMQVLLPDSNSQYDSDEVDTNCRRYNKGLYQPNLSFANALNISIVAWSFCFKAAARSRLACSFVSLSPRRFSSNLFRAASLCANLPADLVPLQPNTL